MMVAFFKQTECLYKYLFTIWNIKGYINSCIYTVILTSHSHIHSHTDGDTIGSVLARQMLSVSSWWPDLRP